MGIAHESPARGNNGIPHCAKSEVDDAPQTFIHLLLESIAAPWEKSILSYVSTMIQDKQTPQRDIVDVPVSPVLEFEVQIVVVVGERATMQLNKGNRGNVGCKYTG